MYRVFLCSTIFESSTNRHELLNQHEMSNDKKMTTPLIITRRAGERDDERGGGLIERGRERREREDIKWLIPWSVGVK